MVKESVRVGEVFLYVCLCVGDSLYKIIAIVNNGGTESGATVWTVRIGKLMSNFQIVDSSCNEI